MHRYCAPDKHIGELKFTHDEGCTGMWIECVVCKLSPPGYENTVEEALAHWRRRFAGSTLLGEATDVMNLDE